MSTKTTFKRVALVTVAALGFGLLSSVAPASAAASTGIALNTSSMTVVGTASGETAHATIRINVSNTDYTTPGLAAGESITATVTGVPTGVTAKTVGGNASDLSFMETVQTGSNLVSDWTKGAVTTVVANQDTALIAAHRTDGVIGSGNTGYTGMDGADTSSVSTTANTTVKSYYLTIYPTFGASVTDQGVYTITLNHTDTNQNLISTTTLKLDFVSTSIKSGALMTLSTAGTFVASETVGYTSTKYAKLVVTNRDAGKILTYTGGAVAPTMSITDSDGLAITPVTASGGITRGPITAVDDGTAGSSGTYGKDFGTFTTAAGFTANNGTFGVTWGAYYTWDALGNTLKAVYGATTATKAITVYAASTGNTATAAATGTGLIGSTPSYTAPLSTKSVTVTATVLTSAAVAVQDYPVTFTTTWTGAAAGDVSPVSGSTGSSVVKTDVNGKASITLTYATPADGASASVSAVAGGVTATSQVITWAKSKPASVSVDPAGPMTVALKAVTKATFTVLDAFGAPVVGEVMTLSLATGANNAAGTTTLPSAITDANGQVSYTLTDAAAIATDTDAITATATSVSGKSATLSLTYAATVPVASSMKVYYDAAETTWSTLVPLTTIYETGTTGYTLNQAKDVTKSLATSPSPDDVIGFNATVLTSASAAASGVPVTVSVSDGGWILSSAGLPVKSRVFYTGSTGKTGLIQVTATTVGTKTLTFTAGAVTSTATIAFTNGTSGATGRFLTLTAAAGNATATAAADALPSFTVKVTDNLGNPVSGVQLNITATGVGRLATGGKTAQWTTDASGEYTFELTSTTAGATSVSVAATTTGQFSDPAGYIGAVVVTNAKAGNRTVAGTVTFADAAVSAASTAADAAAEATDAANAATDAANAAAEAADAATAAAQDAADAVAALSAQVATLISGLKAQLTALTNLVIKIQKKVKA